MPSSLFTVMISSTAADLPEHRRQAIAACQSFDVFPIAMESLPASSEDAISESLRMVDKADIYLGIYAWRYGTVPAGRDISITEMELDAAIERGLPILIFLIHDDHPGKLGMMEDDPLAQQRLKELKRKACAGRIKADFRSTAELKAEIATALHHQLAKMGSPGGAAPQPPERLAYIRFPAMKEKFAGRLALLEELARVLQPGQAAGLSQRAAVQADGGVGKTALAVELGWRLFEEGKFDYVLLLNATSPDTLHNDLASLCTRDQLNLPEQAAREQEARWRGVLAWLKTTGNARRTLLILDGADSPEAQAAVRELHPRLPGCALLVTSRGQIGGGIPAHELELFTAGEAREFLRARLNPIHLQGADAGATLDGLAQAVDHLPLALELVASYLRESRQSPQEWLREWQAVPASTLTHYNAADTSYPVALFRVWEQSVARLSAEARGLLCGLAWIAPRPAGFPIEPIQKLKTHGDIRTWLIELARASLLQWPEEADEFTIHRVFQMVMRHRMTPEEKNDALDLGRIILDASLPSSEFDIVNWRLWERLSPHMRVVLDHVRETPQEKDATQMMTRYGQWLDGRAQHAEAEPLLRRALAIDLRNHGKEAPQVAVDLNNLAQLLQATNRLREAEPMMLLALAIDEKCYGQDHLRVGIRLNNLGALLQATNRFEQAEGLLRRALAIEEKSHRSDRLDIAHCLTNLAQLLQSTNRLKEAEPLMRRSLAIVEKCYGKDSPLVAVPLNNLASLLQYLHQMEEAEVLQRRALEINKRCYGEEHPKIVLSLNNLAQLLQTTGRFAEAEEMMRLGLKIDERSYGKMHPRIAVELNNLAQLLKATNRLGEAEPLLRRHLGIFLQFAADTGYEHPHFRQGLANYHELLSEMGWEKARIEEEIVKLARQCKKAIEEKRVGREAEGGGV